MLPQDKALAWLVLTLFVTSNINDGDDEDGEGEEKPIPIPARVLATWIELGWYDADEEEFTDHAIALAEMSAPEWGIDFDFEG